MGAHWYFDSLLGRLELSELSERLSGGETAVFRLEDEGSSEAAVSGAALVGAPVEATIAAASDLAVFRSPGDGGFIERLGTVASLDSLKLPDDAVEDLRKLGRGKSHVNLSEAEALAIAAAAPADRPGAYKRVLRDRVFAWRRDGLRGLRGYAGGSPVDQVRVTRRLLAAVPSHVPLESLEVDETFEFVSVERIAHLKPIVGLGSATVSRHGAAAQVDVVQLYASHYFHGLVLRIELHPVPGPSGDATLVRATLRAELDLLSGFFGAVAGPVVRHKVAERVEASLAGVRDTVERGLDEGEAEKRANAS